MSLAPVSLESAIASSPKKIKVLLLENVHKVAVERFQESQYEITFLNKSLSEQELISIIPDYHVLGIRSVTEVNQKVIAAAKNLLVIGCFCIGTNQVDLKTARLHGIPVFNSPFSNSRSVAELIIAQVISLSRRLGDKNNELHSGIWNKSAINCHEVRGKTLGIVGYGHIGSQLSVLAEAMGMRVLFYDTLKKLPLGNSTQINSLDNLLGKSDFVSLHVPELDSTKNMMSKQKFALMKKGSYLLNASRGSVVVLEDLADAIKSGHIAGAYVDVYPEEPKMKVNDFKTPLQGLDNVLLTPHIGGSTEEAQEAIGVEVSGRIVSFINEGISEGAVNFPNIILQYNGPDTHRILNIHQNKPGVLRDINDVLSCYNIENQVLKTKGEIGYLLVEVDSNAHNEIQARIAGMPSSIRTRVLF